MIPLVKSDPRAWALMPAVLERVRSFCERFDSDTTPGVLTQSIVEHFVCDTPTPQVPTAGTVRVLAALRDVKQVDVLGGQALVAIDAPELVGHCLVTVDSWCGKVFATIVQYQMDTPLSTPQVRDTMDQVMWWAKARGASVLRVLAVLDERGPARVRAFRALYGFRPTRQILDREIG